LKRYPKKRSGDGERHRGKPKACPFCADNAPEIDYKNEKLLRRMVSDSGKIMPRRRTAACAKHQRALARAIKRARMIAILPFTQEPLP